MSTYIIAEAGVNHNGNIDIAMKLIEEASQAGADAIKFQTFKAENVVTHGAKKASYQVKNTSSSGSQYRMLKKLELPFESHYKLMDYCSEKNIDFLSTAFDLESLEFLYKNLNLQTLKIPSGELTNAPLLLEFGRSGRNLILSTGMANLDEIDAALNVIAFGLTGNGIPSSALMKNNYKSRKTKDLLKEKVTLLHCTTEYPAPLNEINLRAIKTLKNTFDLNIGYSDHSEGIQVSISATVLGASVIEKHFTLDKTSEGPDHKASLEPSELKEMVKGIRNVDEYLGDGIKEPTESEMKNIEIARRSIVANEKISKGTRFSAENLTTKRPATGKSPMDYWNLIGKKSRKDYEKDEIID